jgi:hypothetical protein
VLAGLGGRIAAVLDGGACPVGVESTIVGLDGPPGSCGPAGLPVEAIEACLGQPLLPPGAKVAAPGQLASHYAPEAALRLNATAAAPGEVLLGFGPVAGDLNLSPAGDLTEAAANLFHHLRALDARGGRIAWRRSRTTGSAGRSTTASPGRRHPRLRAEAGGALPLVAIAARTCAPDPPRDICGSMAPARQARPPEDDRSRASTPISPSAAAHFLVIGGPKTSPSEASQVSQPLRWISPSSCPGPQPA